MEIKKQPEIRFSGLVGDWEERNLGDEFEKVNERNDGSFDKSRWISVAKMYFQDPEKVQSNNIDTRTYVMREGDIAFEGHPNKDFAFGRFVANDIGPGVVSELFPIYRHKGNYDNNYWKNAIQLERIMAPIFARSITSSGNSSNKLNPAHFLRQKINIPNLKEQKLIGSFFQQLDKDIALHQQELTTLKQTKQGFLQKMFPKEGEKVPEVRFPEFTDEWEQCKLGDIFKKDTQKNKDLEFHSDSVISVAKMKLSPPSAKSSDEYMKTYNKIRKGNIAFEGHTNDEFPNGRFVLNDCQDGIVSHIYDVYSAVDEYNNEFMKRYINNPDVMRKILINATSSARMMKSLNSIEFLKQSILLPILSEQQKIGEFFYQLDNTLTLHQRELELLQLTKKAFLQKLFV